MASDYISKERMGTTPLWTGRAPLLPHLDMELTERCNNNCIHCYINQPEQAAALKERELTTEELKSVIRKAADLGCMSIRFTGGEPLLKKDFAEIYLFTRRLGIRVTLFTNATLITASLADLFRKYPPGEKIEITLYGQNAKAYEEVSLVRGSFEKAMRGLTLLAERAVPFWVKGIYFKGREEDRAALEHFAETLSFMEKPPSFAMNFDLRARRDMPEKVAFIKSLRISPEETVASLLRYREDYVKGSRAFARKFMGPAGDALFNCGCGKGGSVDPYGFFQPCLLLRHPEAVYDLRQGTFEQAMEEFFPELRKRISQNPRYLERCAKCFLHGFCDQCPAKSWMEHGTLDTPVEYFCEIAHAKARLLGLLGQEEKAWEVRGWEKRIADFVNS